MARARRYISQAVHDTAKRLAAIHPQQVVAEILGLHASQITRMKQRGWKAYGGMKKRPRPKDFEEQNKAKTVNELAEHYRAGFTTIARWRSELIYQRPSWKGDTLRHKPIRKRQPAAQCANFWSGKTEEEKRALRERQWEERRRKYGPSGQRPRAK